MSDQDGTTLMALPSTSGWARNYSNEAPGLCGTTNRAGHRHQRFRRFGLGVWLQIVLQLAFAGSQGSLSAQTALDYDRTSFIHGFGSSGTMWRRPYNGLWEKSVIEYLRENARVDLGGEIGSESSPTLDGLPARLFDEQHAVLGQFLSATPGRHVLVGHSMGSLLSRYTYINASPTAREQIAGIVAVTAPHQGAEIAVYAPAARKYFTDTQAAVNDALNEIDAALISASVLGFLAGVFLTIVGGPTPLTLLAYLASFLFLVPLPDGLAEGDLESGVRLTRLKVLGDIPPADIPAYRVPIPERDSADPRLRFEFIEMLNSNTADAAIARANVYADRGSHKGAIIDLANTQAGTEYRTPGMIKARDGGAKLLEGCAFVAGLTFMSGKERRCSRASKLLKIMDRRWLMYTTGYNKERRRPLSPEVCRVFPDQCTPDGYVLVDVPIGGPTDAVVPNARSIYPGLTDPIKHIRVAGRTHLSIYRKDDGADKIALGMRLIGMPEIEIPPLDEISFTGPKSLVAGQNGTWSATPHGGVPPYRFEWAVNGQVKTYATGSTFTYSASGSRMTVSVKVVDQAGQEETASSTVFITESLK